MTFSALIYSAMKVLWPLFVATFAVFMLILITNLIYLPRLKPGASKKGKKLSIMIPARNEELTIEKCVRSLLAQDYENFEIIVVNENSTDSTGEILARLSAEDARLIVVQGKPLPDGWIGMCWGCMQAARAATGDILLFVDADTWHTPFCASSTMEVFEKTGANLVSGITRQIVGTFGEAIAESLMPFGMLSLFPVVLMHNFKFVFPAMAIGQFMAFKREDYFAIGGHEAVKSHVTLDMQLAKIFKARRLKVILTDATYAVSVRMYHNFKQAFLGFTKNVFGSFNFRVLPFAGVFIFMMGAFWLPILYLFTSGFGVDAFMSGISLLIVAMCVLIWILYCIRSYMPLYLVVIYPINFTVWFVMSMNSMIQAIFGKSVWKGRKMPRPRIRLI